MTKENYKEPINKPEQAIEPPPALFGSWKNLYLLVIGNLAFMIILFYLFTLYFQ